MPEKPKPNIDVFIDFHPKNYSFSYEKKGVVVVIPFSIVLRLQRNFSQNYSSSNTLEFFEVKTVGYERYDTYVYCNQKSEIYIQWLHSYKRLKS